MRKKSVSGQINEGTRVSGLMSEGICLRPDR
jgi:hypothetical protein